MSPNRIETADDLQRIVDEQNEAIIGLGNLVAAMDTGIRGLVGENEKNRETLQSLLESVKGLIEQVGDLAKHVKSHAAAIDSMSQPRTGGIVH